MSKEDNILQQYIEQQKRNQEAEFTELVRDFLNPAEFYNSCLGVGVDYFTGVPDSLLKGKILKYTNFNYLILTENLDSNGQQFDQYQQYEQSHLASNH